MDYEKIEKSARIKKRALNTVIYTLLTFWAIMVLFPFYWMLLTSVKSYSAYNGEYIPQLFTLSPTFENYKLAFTAVPLLDYFVNTVIFTLVTTALMLIPQYIVMSKIKIIDTYWAFILPQVQSALGLYLMQNFMMQVPEAMLEAARIDGATRFYILRKVILPLAKPIVIYTILTAFMGPWGDFSFARYISMNNVDGMNAAVGLFSWLNVDQINNNYTMFCAGGVVVAVPVTLLFIFLQKYYVEGVTGGAVKG